MLHYDKYVWEEEEIHLEEIFFIFSMATPFSIEIKPVFKKYLFKGQQKKITILVWSPTELELN